MNRIVIVALLSSLSLAEAQPADPYADPKPAKPVKKPAKGVPADPYADPAPDTTGGMPDPYGPPAKPAKAAPPKKTGKPGPPKPVDPYDAPAGDKVVDPFDAKHPVPQKPVDPYADPAGKVVDPFKAKPMVPLETAAPAIPNRVGLTDVTAVQGLLAVQHLDGWLLFDRDGENPIAQRLVAPTGHPTRAWFYLVPAQGQPLALVHTAELRSFDHLVGKKLTYQGFRDLDKQLKVLLKGMKTVAVEYSAKAAVPAVSHVDAGTIEEIRATGVQVKSSDTLVQYTKAIWGDAGRTAHYVAAHHLVELRKEALAFVTKQLQTGSPVSEYDVQQRLVRGMTMRGLVGTPPVVAAGVNTADPYYVPTAERSAPIKRGDLVVISLAARLDKPEGIYAAQTWCAIADRVVPENIAKAFGTVTLGRDQALALISDRTRKHRPLTGADVDDATRGFIKKAGLADHVMHRTGHSIDNDLQGGGADLDNYEVKDTRILTPGTGFTIGPGVYFAGEFGVRTEISVYLSPAGPEITTPSQDEIEPLLK
jgi:Xaa-Pro dipeptidase